MPVVKLCTSVHLQEQSDLGQHLSELLTHISLASHFWNIANSTDPEQKLQNVASDQGLHCLLTGISIQNRIKMKK